MVMKIIIMSAWKAIAKFYYSSWIDGASTLPVRNLDRNNMCLKN